MGIHDKPAKPWARMNAAELAEATKGAEDLGFEDTAPLTPEMAVAWDRVKRGRGRPKVGEGAERVLISMEKRLLRITDELARRMGLDRSKLIAHAVRELLRQEAARHAAQRRAATPARAAPASDEVPDQGGTVASERHPIGRLNPPHAVGAGPAPAGSPQRQPAKKQAGGSDAAR